MNYYNVKSGRLFMVSVSRFLKEI